MDLRLQTTTKLEALEVVFNWMLTECMEELRRSEAIAAEVRFITELEMSCRPSNSSCHLSPLSRISLMHAILNSVYDWDFWTDVEIPISICARLHCSREWDLMTPWMKTQTSVEYVLPLTCVQRSWFVAAHRARCVLVALGVLL